MRIRIQAPRSMLIRTRNTGQEALHEKIKKGYLRNSDVEDALLPDPEYGRRVADGPVDL
jgi:hypothetical protein